MKRLFGVAAACLAIAGCGAGHHQSTSATTRQATPGPATTTTNSTASGYGTPATVHGVNGCQTPYGFSPHACGFGKPPTNLPRVVPPAKGLTTQYDAIFLSALAHFQPVALAGYTSGFWPTYLPMVKAYPHAVVKSIAVSASHHAQCLDVEPGDAVASQAGPWVRAVLADKGMGMRSGTSNLPCVYTSLSNMGAVKASLTASGLMHGRDYWLWDANWTNSPHIDVGYDATQYQDHGPNSENVDMSLVTNGFEGISNQPVKPAWWSPNLAKLDKTRRKLGGRRIDERDSVRVWVKDHCLNPTRRAVCKRIHAEAGLEKARIDAVARRQGWKAGKPGSLGGRNQTLQHLLTMRKGT